MAANSCKQRNRKSAQTLDGGYVQQPVTVQAEKVTGAQERALDRIVGSHCILSYQVALVRVVGVLKDSGDLLLFWRCLVGCQ